MTGGKAWMGLAALLFAGLPAAAAPEEGETIGHAGLERLAAHVPPDLWSVRGVLFHEAMQLEVGPAFRDYRPPPEHGAGGDATCAEGEPATELARRFDRRWLGGLGRARFRLTRLGPGRDERVTPEVLEGGWSRQALSGDARWVESLDFTFPRHFRKLRTLRFRPVDPRRLDETWAYAPLRHEVIRIDGYGAIPLLDAELAFDDRFGFDGRVERFEWECLGERPLLAPVNARAPVWPEGPERSFGAAGASLADDRWELRRAVGMRMASGPARKTLWLDAQTLVPLYASEVDERGTLRRVFAFAHRWSEDDPELARGWDGVTAPRSLRMVAMVVWDVPRGRGLRLEHWNNRPQPVSAGRLRRMTDLRSIAHDERVGSRGRGSAERPGRGSAERPGRGSTERRGR